MKPKLLFFIFTLLLTSGTNLCFSQDNNPKWNIDPRTLISLNPQGTYIELPQGDNANFSNETRYIGTPQGIFAVGPNFRVHPTSSRTQSETPITRHPTNPDIMFASANTFNVGGTTTFSTGHYVTTDGGLTFFGDDTTNFNFGDPGPMIMHTGRILISYITSTGAMGAAYSVNNGSTWSGTVTFPGSTTSSDKNLSCVDDTPTSAFFGRCYTVYTEFSGAYTNRIVATWSSDGGVTWSTVVPISPVPSAGHHHQGCDVAVDIYGWVRVVYANCTTNGQNSTEDSLGWAESGDGGVSWGDMSAHKVNTNGIRSSDFLTPSNVAIRVNGFPRIDDDETCLSSADDEYVVMAEKNFAPALDNGDIVLMKTPDGGSTWTRTRVNQNASGSYEWCPAVNVDATGAINVCYYSTRNVPTNDSAQIYLSRSTDGGTTWVDVLISDHKFKPVPISGTATGYQGDYIGITSGGAGKILPYWCEQNTSTGGRYQAYSALVDISIGNLCEDFSCNKDTGSTSTQVVTRNFYEEFSGTNYWNRRSTASAYNSGTGSARFNSWSASASTTQSLTSYLFTAVGANTYLTFDEAYAPWSGGNIDSLIVESSVNGGTSYTNRARLWGGLGAQAGPLNTVFVGGGQFTPTGGQWRPKIYLLPSGTNKVRLRAVSGFGNDIWIDNVCVQTLAAPVANSIGVFPEGMAKCNSPYVTLNDSVRVYLCRSDFPSVIVDSAIGVIDNGAVLNLTAGFSRALTGNYYRKLVHRNAMETWSAVGYAYTRGGNTHYNFITPSGQAFANNQKLICVVQNYRAMYSGDVIKDANDIIDASDLIAIGNDANIIASGYPKTDLNGDGITDATDIIICFNNVNLIVTIQRPPGAEPTPAPTVEDVIKSTVVTNQSEREKLEQTIRLMKEPQSHQTKETDNGINKEQLESVKKMLEEHAKKHPNKLVEENIKVETNSDYPGAGVQ